MFSVERLLGMLALPYGDVGVRVGNGLAHGQTELVDAAAATVVDFVTVLVCVTVVVVTGVGVFDRFPPAPRHEHKAETLADGWTAIHEANAVGVGEASLVGCLLLTGSLVGDDVGEVLVGGLPERNVYTVLADPDVMVSILVDVTNSVLVLALPAPLLTVAGFICAEHQLLASLCCW